MPLTYIDINGKPKSFVKSSVPETWLEKTIESAVEAKKSQARNWPCNCLDCRGLDALC
jgi:hypothetical protein